MKNKILIKITGIAVAMCLLLASCAKNVDNDVAVDFEPVDAVNEILSQVEMSSMAEVQSDRLSDYIDFDQSKIEKFSMYICGSGGFADEVGIFKLDSNQSANELKEVVSERIEDREVDFKNYNPDEYTKLQNALIECDGNYLFYCVTGDNDTAKSVFDKYYK